MTELTPEEKDAIIKRREYTCDTDGKKHQKKNLDIHHKDLHKRAGY